MDGHLFEGLKVIDAATVIAGPAAAMMLADFGADVIKIENPRGGDMLRHLSTMPDLPEGGKNYMWQMDGRNKRSIALDLADQRGLRILHELIAECDVFITNMPYPSREKFKLCYEDVKPQNEAMIYASLTAYGEIGEERDRKGFDQLAYWARSGLMDLMRAPGTSPTQGLPGMGDHPTAVSIYAGIVTALLKRERTGEGSFVHTSLLANGLWSNSATAQGVMAGADTQKYRTNSEHPGFSFHVYQAADGRWLQFNMVRNEELMNLMFTAMDAMDILIEEPFSTPAAMYKNRDQLIERIQAIIASKPSTEWLDIFDSFGVPINRIGIVEESPTDPQVQLNRMAIRPEDPNVEIPLVVNHPVQVSGVAHKPMKLAPKLGEQSKQILTELGYGVDEIDDLINENVVAIPQTPD